MSFARNVRKSSLVVLTAFLTACASGGGLATNGPAPPYELSLTAPTPPAPLPSPRALLAPVQTSDAAAFIDSFGATVFPLLLTSVSANFESDAATTSQGATLALNGQTWQSRITINNPDFGITDHPGWDRRINVGASGPGFLDYTTYGTWWIRAVPTGWFENGAAWTGGFATQAHDLPASGTASYSGDAVGLYSERHGCNCDSSGGIRGLAHISADFGARTVSGSLTKLTVISENIVGGPVNDIGFSANLDASRNMFTGTTRVLTAGEGRNDFAPNATGPIAGRFFGPEAAEVGAVWTISDGVHHTIGSFGAKQ